MRKSTNAPINALGVFAAQSSLIYERLFRLKRRGKLFGPLPERQPADYPVLGVPSPLRRVPPIRRPSFARLLGDGCPFGGGGVAFGDGGADGDAAHHLRVQRAMVGQCPRALDGRQE